MKCFVATIVPDVNSLQKPVQLAALQAEYLLLTLGPDKPMALQPLLPEAKTVTVPIEDLDHAPAAVAERKQMSGERIQRHVHLYQEAKTVDRLSHIGGAHREEDAQVLREYHLIPRSAVTTCLRVGGSNPGQTSMQRSGASATRKAVGRGP